MTSPRIGLAPGTVHLEQTRTPQTPRQSFDAALQGGVQGLLAGAEIATGVLGGPVLTAAVRNLRRQVASLPAPARAAAAVTAGLLAPGAGPFVQAPPLGVGPTGAFDPAAPAEDGALDAVRRLQRESRDYNLELLALQEDVQRENRQFSTLSNVLKARHETARAAIGNLRS
jgi:hypothetical protein